MIKMTERQIMKAISNANASLAIEGLKPSNATINYGKKIFKDEISIDEAIDLTTKRILTKKDRLVKL